LPIAFSMLPRRAGIRMRTHLRTLLADFRLAAVRTLLVLAFVPDQAWRMGDAVVRTLTRLFLTRRHLLEWTTAAQSAGRPRLDLVGFYRQMAGGTGLALMMSAGAMIFAHTSWTVTL